MQALKNLIQDELDRWHNTYPLETVFGTARPEEVTQVINTFCQRELGSAIDGCYFYEVSQGIVAGLRLVDGQSIVIKGLINARPMPYLRSVVRIQHYLLKQGYPCTMPLCDPLPLGQGIAMLEQFDGTGAFHDAHDPRWRKPLADLLALLIKLLRNPEIGIESALFDFHLPNNVLWGKPHSNIFDFEATTQGAEWIDEIGREAKEVLDRSTGDLVIGHSDWSTKHVRYLGEQPHIIYDWDSLILDKEPAIVGRAAIYYTYIPFLPKVRQWPTEEETIAFIKEYEAARGKPFSREERQTMAAAITYSQAYGARCQHSLHPHEQENKPATLKHYRDSFLLQ